MAGDREMRAQTAPGGDIITVEDLTVGYGETPALEGLNLKVRQGEILTVLGPSGCGKTTLLRVMAGLLPAWKGRVCVAGLELRDGGLDALFWVHRHLGVLFQSGALLGSYTVAENISLPLREFTDLPPELIDRLVQLKLDLVKLGRYGHDLPAQLSDEPSAGLDPATAVEIDELLVELNVALGVTIVVVTHQLASIENISHRCIMLDGESRGIIASGSLEEIRNQHHDPRVQAFFRRRIQSPSGEEKNG
jgi:phospholipid/cholesterol/gamma-HCH transport system ATP-binding protein